MCYARISIFGALLFFLSLVTIINNAIKREPVKPIFTVLGLSFVLFLVGTILQPTKDSFGPLVEHDVLNGFGTEKIGVYATVDLKSKELTKERIADFYHEYVKGKSYNWITLLITKNTGLHFLL